MIFIDVRLMLLELDIIFMYWMLLHNKKKKCFSLCLVIDVVLLSVIIISLVEVKWKKTFGTMVKMV